MYRELYPFMNHSAKRRSAVGMYVLFSVHEIEAQGAMF
jgi:hypothetical protein